MSRSLIQFTIEGTEKLRAVQILGRLGLSLPAYLRMCVSRLNQENGIPFNMKIEEESNPSICALQKASRIAEEYGIADMTLEEVKHHTYKYACFLMPSFLTVVL
ncbi:MAG: type II toxin-antitoxin system RelB/DinJ family antitoxin [Oscillospiraceae bacterium]|nr:type II toxin-antitoxin system RelB/DinJ family antitoxin [Oscillospiraceae bacterium]